MAIALVQTIPGSAASTNTLTLTLGSGTGAGNCLVVAIATVGATTDPTGGTITLGGVAGNFSERISESASGVCETEIWVCENIAGGQTAIAITLTGGVGTVGMFAWAYEFSGVLQTGGAAVDKSIGQSVTSPTTTWTSTATATTTQAVEAWVGICGVGAGTAPTITGPTSPWVNLASQTGTIGTISSVAITGSQITSATGAATYSGTISTSQEYSACVLTLLPAPAVSSGGAQPGKTWRRRFHHRQQRPFAPIFAQQYQPRPSVTLVAVKRGSTF
jgi:hypothetical protein